MMFSKSSLTSETPFGDYLRSFVSKLIEAELPSCDHQAGFRDSWRVDCQRSGNYGDRTQALEWLDRQIQRLAGSWACCDASLASSYQSMEAFWADAAAQERAESIHAYWDTYENGRRRQIERRVAEAFESDGAVLVNSGMSALEAALGSVLNAGDCLLAPRSCYFETYELLEELERRGVVVVRHDYTDSEGPETACPDVVLVETVSNSPNLVSARPMLPEATFVIDNTLPSHSTTFPTVARWVGGEALVVESGLKYLTRQCSMGVVYGAGRTLDRVREYVRRTGVALQSRALYTLTAAELETTGQRHALHATHAAEFAESLDRDVWSVEGGRATGEGRWSPGALVFCTLRTPSAGAHTRVLDAWIKSASAVGARVDVRAGFGWHRTSGRAYDGLKLNQPDAPEFLRVSVGLEDADTLRQLAALLNTAAQALAPSSDQDGARVP